MEQNGCAEEGKEPEVYTEEEYEVSGILLNLKCLIAEDELRKSQETFMPRWRTKERSVRRGTRTDSSPSANLPYNKSPSSSSSLPSPLQNGNQEQQEVKVDATSPNTPLAISTSTESDDKSSHSNSNKFTKRKRDELMKSMNGLADCREILRKEVENVTSYYNELLAVNKELKARKQQMIESTSTCHDRKEANLESLNCVQTYPIGMIIQNQSCLIAEEKAMESIMPEQQMQQMQQQYPYGHYGQVEAGPKLFDSSSGLGKVNHVGPLDILDLNGLGVASSQPLDYSRVFVDNRRAVAAEARRNRMMKKQQKSKLRFKLMKTKVANKPPPLTI